MKSVLLGSSNIESSRLVYGCMRIADDGVPVEQGMRAIRAAVDAGFTLFDHADIYANGAAELLFARVLRDSPGLREQISIIGKCGIRDAADSHPDAPKRYDFSREYIVKSVEGSLARLDIEQLDMLLLHRPDFLMDPAEVADAFDSLLTAGKVATFGVSNFGVSQVELLQAALHQRLHVNQVEINIHNIDALSNGVLDQCQRIGMTPQAWCPLGGVAYPAWGSTLTAEDDARIRAELSRQSGTYQVEPWVVMLAWLLKHPAGISPIVGSTRPDRIRQAAASLDLDYSREDWYRLLEARIGSPVP